MKHAESVAFGGSTLDRAAHMRTDQAALERLRKHPDAQSVVMWRGKPLVKGEERDRLALVALDHPVLGDGQAQRDGLLFLGMDEQGAPLFACDISAWQPDDLDHSALGQFLDPSEQQHPSLPKTHVFGELRRLMTRLNRFDAEIAAAARALTGWHATHGFCAVCGAPSKVSHGGWQRTCPDCNRHHFPRTDPVVIMLVTHGNSVLVGRSPGWPEGMFSLLAGFVEPGETLEAAVRREVMEEVGVPVSEVSYLASQPWPFPASLMIGCAGEALSRDLTIDPVEIEQALWITREDMMMVFAAQHPVMKPPRSGAIAHFLLKNWLADTLE